MTLKKSQSSGPEADTLILGLERTRAGAIVSARTPSADRNPVVRIDAAIRSASGARVQHWSSLFHELVFPAPQKIPCSTKQIPCSVA